MATAPTASEPASFVLDTSVLVAILLAEPGWQNRRLRLATATWIGIGATTLFETHIVMARKLQKNSGPAIEALLRQTNYEILPFTAEHLRIAQDASLRYGKGRHPGALNYGDCMAYATARVAGRPLLYAGDDFSQTDAAPA